MVLLELNDAELGYDNSPVLHHISLTIEAGEKVALIGPSGAGKSTLLNRLHALIHDQTAFCPQSHGLVGPLSLYNNIYMARLEQFSAFGNLWNLIRPQRWNDVAAIASKLGLLDKMKTSVDKLSGGQRQRVAIGRALYRNKPVFMGDEPVSSLDPLQAQRLLMHICESHRTLIVAIHDRQLALSCFDRIIGLKHGKIAFDKPTSQLDIIALNQLYQP
ncbi:ATP-binding cassette domain-containing protein [Photobacterium sp.]|uniref:ATP-binding cassette domain-containing protein n=1 Tax=Photobacterium sp. TaxID=660 RepID=UPI00299EF083|nr:ATP-binding cassette domain-containing protein [Photobacterium sp.]MDX1300844.1 ATP-binding cassette domain-containing protein [Photobacterium sp.]